MVVARVPLSFYSYLFAQVFHYFRGTAEITQDIERRLFNMGRSMGPRLLELVAQRRPPTGDPWVRETKLEPFLNWIRSVFFAEVFGRQASAVERVTSKRQFYIRDKEPFITEFTSQPEEFSALHLTALTGGIVCGVLVAAGFSAEVKVRSSGSVTFYVVTPKDE